MFWKSNEAIGYKWITWKFFPRKNTEKIWKKMKDIEFDLNEDGNSVMNNIEQCYYDMGVGNPTVNSQLTFSCTKIETL